LPGIILVLQYDQNVFEMSHETAKWPEYDN